MQAFEELRTQFPRSFNSADTVRLNDLRQRAKILSQHRYGMFAGTPRPDLDAVKNVLSDVFLGGALRTVYVKWASLHSNRFSWGRTTSHANSAGIRHTTIRIEIVPRYPPNSGYRYTQQSAIDLSTLAHECAHAYLFEKACNGEVCGNAECTRVFDEQLLPTRHGGPFQCVLKLLNDAIQMLKLWGCELGRRIVFEQFVREWTVEYWKWRASPVDLEAASRFCYPGECWWLDGQVVHWVPMLLS